MAQVFAHHRAVFKLHQGVVIAASGAGFGELLDVQLAQESGHLAIDVFRAVVGMEALDGEGEGGEEGFEDREQEAFADAFYRADELELGDRIDEIDVVEPLDPVQRSPWLDRIDAQEAWTALWARFAAFPDGGPSQRGFCPPCRGTGNRSWTGAGCRYGRWRYRPDV